MSDIIFNISGGNNQILPNATEAVQNFYGDQYAEKILQKETPSEPINPALEKLALYINKESLSTYIAQIGACESATELAKVVVSIVQQDSKLTPEEIVKELATQLIFITGCCQPLYGFVHGTYFTLRAGGKSVVTFLFDSAYMWVLPIPIVFLLARFTPIPVQLVYLLAELSNLIKCIVG